MDHSVRFTKPTEQDYGPLWPLVKPFARRPDLPDGLRADSFRPGYVSGFKSSVMDARMYTAENSESREREKVAMVRYLLDAETWPFRDRLSEARTDFVSRTPYYMDPNEFERRLRTLNPRKVRDYGILYELIATVPLRFNREYDPRRPLAHVSSDPRQIRHIDSLYSTYLDMMLKYVNEEPLWPEAEKTQLQRTIGEMKRSMGQGA